MAVCGLRPSVTPASWCTGGSSPCSCLHVYCVNRDYFFFYFFQPKVQFWLTVFIRAVGKTYICTDLFPTLQIYLIYFFSDGIWVSKSVMRSRPSYSLCCVSHIIGKDEIIFQEEFISGCGLWERWREMSGYPTQLWCALGKEVGEAGCFLLDGAGAEMSVVTCIDLQKCNLFQWFTLFFKFLEKQPSERTLFCHFMLVERKHSWCNLKWQNHYTSVMKNASDFLVFLFS